MNYLGIKKGGVFPLPPVHFALLFLLIGNIID